MAGGIRRLGPAPENWRMVSLCYDRRMKAGPAILVMAVLAACGSGNSEPIFGGFTPANGAAVILAPAVCNNIPVVGPTAISGILIELAAGGDACNILTQAHQCGSGAGSTLVLAGALSGVPGGSTVAPAGPGSYPYLPNPPSGAFKTSTTTAAKVDGTCTSAPGTPLRMRGGSIEIASVTASKVTGTMDVHFDNGQVYDSSFDADVCPVSIDICSLFDFCGTHTCVQQ
jgi:hypothetical protein